MAKDTKQDNKEPKEESKPQTTDEKIINAYQTGSNSLQDLARIYNVDINHVLILTGNEHLATVELGGDLIGQDEAGKGAQINGPTEVDTPISLN